jgi:hypothetical protein
MKKLILIAVLMIISIPTFSQAASTAGSSLQLGVGYRYFDYKEDLPAALRSTESGWLPDVNLSYTYKKKSNFYARIYGDYASADITFDGTTMGGTPISFSDSHQKFFKFEADFGYAVGVADNFLLIPYIGYGYRYWERGQARKTATYTTFEEDYSWSYIPIGLKADYDINERWNIGGTIAINIMFNGKMKAYPSKVIAGVNDPEFDLGNKIGFYVDLPITYKLTSNWSIVGTPWYEYSEIGQSNNVNITYGGTVVGYAYEPGSKTNQYGFNLGASYSF